MAELLSSTSCCLFCIKKCFFPGLQYIGTVPAYAIQTPRYGTSTLKTLQQHEWAGHKPYMKWQRLGKYLILLTLVNKAIVGVDVILSLPVKPPGTWSRRATCEHCKDTGNQLVLGEPGGQLKILVLDTTIPLSKQKLFFINFLYYFLQIESSCDRKY